jgi:hypothetical protein
VEIENQIKHLHHRNGSRISPNWYPLHISKYAMYLFNSKCCASSPGYNAAMTSTQTMRSSSCPTMSSMSTDGMNKMNPIIQNATTADYKIELGIGPTANMLMMCQVTSSTTSGEVMVASQMSPMSMTGNTYHLELHVYDIKTGAAEVVPINSVGITVTNSSGTKTTIPVAEMFDIGQGPTDFHYGNNVQLIAGNYTVDTNIGSENASFNVTISAMSSGMSPGMSMK